MLQIPYCRRVFRRYNFVGCLGVELVHFQGLLLEASGDLFFHYSLKPNRPLAVFPFTVGVNYDAKFEGIRRLKVWRQISNLHVFQYQDFVVFFKEIFTGELVPDRVPSMGQIDF